MPPLLAQVQLARKTAALGAGRYDEAYEQLARIFDPHDAAYHPRVRAWALVDLAEAAPPRPPPRSGPLSRRLAPAQPHSPSPAPWRLTSRGGSGPSADGLDHYAVGMKDPEGNEFDIN